jgi:putative endonuclease
MAWELKMKMKRLGVYILLCADGSYYTGVTNDIERRIKEHETGINPRCYTYKRRPVELVYFEVFWTPKEAIEWEKRIKGWSRAKKEALIIGNWDKLQELSACNNITSNFFRKERAGIK